MFDMYKSRWYILNALKLLLQFSIFNKRSQDCYIAQLLISVINRAVVLEELSICVEIFLPALFSKYSVLAGSHLSERLMFMTCFPHKPGSFVLIAIHEKKI